jgi:hypothetical protein
VVVLGRFLYRNDAIVDDYLGQLEAGVADSEVRSQTRDRNGSLEFMGVGGGIASSSSIEQNLRQNGASRFARLYNRLDSAEPRLLWRLDEIDAATWSCLGPDCLVEVEVDVSMSMLTEIMGIIGTVPALMGAAGAFGSKPFDPATKRQVKALSTFAAEGMGRAVTVLGVSCASPAYSFGLRLENDSLLIPLADVEGRCIVLGQIEKIVENGEKELVLDIPVAKTMNRAERRKAAKSAAPGEELATTIEGPGAMLEVVALYRGGTVTAP